jgi:hypothetical protein
MATPTGIEPVLGRGTRDETALVRVPIAQERATGRSSSTFVQADDLRAAIAAVTRALASAADADQALELGGPSNRPHAGVG